VVHTQLPYLWPFNAPDSWNLNVAKFKAHEMGLTLASKNWQGSHAAPFQQYCGAWPDIDALQKLEQLTGKEFIHPKVHEVVRVRQLALGFRAALIADDSTQLRQWIEGAKRCEFGALVRFAYGLQKDISAVAAAVDNDWSTGQVQATAKELVAGPLTCQMRLRVQQDRHGVIELWRLHFRAIGLHDAVTDAPVVPALPYFLEE
jgi:hypothetical protein